MTVINTNKSALIATNALSNNERAMQKTMQQLSTGSRINGAGDDAAGLSIRENMTSQIIGLNAAVRNANDAINMLQTADGSLGDVTDMLQRMRELGVTASTDTYSSSQKKAMDDEYQALLTQVNLVATSTQWNKFGLLTGSGGEVGGSGKFVFQVGANAGQTISVAIADQSTNAAAALQSIAGTVLTSGAYAAAAVSAIDGALSTLNTNRSALGAAVNRLQHAINNLTNVAQNATDSRSRVTDTDYSKATSDLARQQIIQQAGTAMLAQANQQPSTVLALLR
jgi:flagellin